MWQNEVQSYGDQRRSWNLKECVINSRQQQNILINYRATVNLNVNCN